MSSWVKGTHTQV